MIYCLYHKADFDGLCSAAIVKRYHPSAKLIPFNYGFKTPKFKENSVIYLVDISLPVDEMIQLNQQHCLIWIDHHISAIQEAREKEFSPKGLRKVAYSACELCWLYFYPSQHMPLIIRLLGRYDVFDLDTLVGTLEFQYAFRTIEEVDPDKNFSSWAQWFHHDEWVREYVEKGQDILSYIRSNNKRRLEQAGISCKLWGYDGIVLNTLENNSLSFCDKECDIYLAYWITKDFKASCSLYRGKNSRLNSVVPFAKQMGGGGHAGAAGFSCTLDALKELIK